jgi:major coat protein
MIEPKALVLRLDKDQVRALGLDDALNVGDECQLIGVAKVTSTSKRAGDFQGGQGTVDLKIIKIGLKPTDSVDKKEEPIADYAKRRNAELHER